MTTLEDLYYGNISPHERYIKRGTRVGELVKAPLPLELAFLIVSYIILGGDIVLKAAKNITKDRVFDENFLMTLKSFIPLILLNRWDSFAPKLILHRFYTDMITDFTPSL